MLVLPCSTESLEYLVQHLEEYLVKNRTVHSNTAARIDTARTALNSSSQSISHLLTAGLLPSQTAADTREDYSNSSGEGILLSDISLHERLVINASFRQSFPNLATLKTQPTGFCGETGVHQRCCSQSDFCAKAIVWDKAFFLTHPLNAATGSFC